MVSAWGNVTEHGTSLTYYVTTWEVCQNILLSFSFLTHMHLSIKDIILCQYSINQIFYYCFAYFFRKTPRGSLAHSSVREISTRCFWTIGIADISRHPQHRCWCTFFKLVYFLAQIMRELVIYIFLWCTFTGLSYAMVYQNWQISGVTVGGLKSSSFALILWSGQGDKAGR